MDERISNCKRAKQNVGQSLYRLITGGTYEAYIWINWTNYSNNTTKDKTRTKKEIGGAIMGEKKKEAAGRISLFLETWFLTMGALKMGFALTKDNKIVIQDSQTGRRADMDKYYNAGKKQSLKNEIGYYIDEIVDTAENMNSLDYFNIEISNHQGKLNVEYKLKNRKKVY